MIGFFVLQSHSNGNTEAGVLIFVFYFDKVPSLAMLELGLQQLIDKIDYYR